MHIPDGFLDLKTCIGTYLGTAGALKFSLDKLKNNFAEEKIPLLGLLGAFIFAAQMINLPIAAGTSGHLLGGVLAMLVVGPWAATIVITAILVIQAIFFMDGGITVLGANIFNMAVVQVFAGYGFYIVLQRITKSAKMSVFLAAFLATVISAGVAALELAISGTIALDLVLPAMIGWHLLVGLIEGVITVLIVSYLERVIPNRLELLNYRVGDCGVH
jgi:cobalt/nickel transport system permease protein